MRRRPGGKPAREAAARRPQRLSGPKAQHDQLPLGHQHPVGLAQHRVGIGGNSSVCGSSTASTDALRSAGAPDWRPDRRRPLACDASATRSGGGCGPAPAARAPRPRCRAAAAPGRTHRQRSLASNCASAWISARPSCLTLPLLQYGDRIGHYVPCLCFVTVTRMPRNTSNFVNLPVKLPSALPRRLQAYRNSSQNPLRGAEVESRTADLQGVSADRCCLIILLAGCAHQPSARHVSRQRSGRDPVQPPPPRCTAARQRRARRTGTRGRRYRRMRPQRAPMAGRRAPMRSHSTATVDSEGLPGPPADSLVVVKQPDLFARLRGGFQLDDVDRARGRKPAELVCQSP